MSCSSLRPTSRLWGFWFAFFLLFVSACGSELVLDLGVPPELSGITIQREGGAVKQLFFGTFTGENFLGSVDSAPQEAKCASQGLFPPQISEQATFFQPYSVAPHLYVESCFLQDAKEIAASARLSQSWLCQHKKNAKNPGIFLYPTERWARIAGTDPPLNEELRLVSSNRFGHQVTALPDGRVVVSGGLSSGIEEMALPLAELSSKLSNLSFAEPILLIDPHASDNARRVQILGRTTRVFHQAFWNGTKLVLIGGRTKFDGASAEIWDVPAAGLETNPSQSAAAGGNDEMRRSFGSVFAIHRENKVFFEQIGGLSEACWKSQGTCKLLKLACITGELKGDEFAQQCGGIEDALFFHQATPFPQKPNESARFLLSGGLFLVEVSKNQTLPNMCKMYGNTSALCANPYLILLRINTAGARSAYLTPVGGYRSGEPPFALEALLGHQTLYMGKHDLGLGSSGALDTFLVAGGWSPHGLSKPGRFPGFVLLGETSYKFSHQVFVLQVGGDSIAPILVPFDVGASNDNIAKMLVRGFSVGMTAPTAPTAQTRFAVLGGGVAYYTEALEGAKSPFIEVRLDTISTTANTGVLKFSLGGTKTLNMRIRSLGSPLFDAQKAPKEWQDWLGAAGGYTATGEFLWVGGFNRPPGDAGGPDAKHAYLFSPGRLGTSVPGVGICPLYELPPAP